MPEIRNIRKPEGLKAKDGSAYIIAEVGVNHNGDLGLAIEHVHQAAAAGADAVKFQNWVAEDFISDKQQMFTYQSKGREVTESFYDLCKRCEMGQSWLGDLRRAASESDIDLLSTPTTERGVDDLIDLGIRILKNGSDYLSHVPLIAYMAERSDILILSTGMANQQDIDYAIEAVRSAGSDCETVLLHCTSVYPTPPHEANLMRMLGLAERYGVPVGYSDHTVGHEAAVQAVTLGACVLEKHFTLSHDLEGPDHWFSVDPDELKIYVDAVRDAEARMGSRELKLAPSEVEIAKEQRLSAVAAHDIKKGDVLSRDDVAFRKPGTGIHPAEIGKLYGMRARVPLKENQVIHDGDFE